MSLRRRKRRLNRLSRVYAMETPATRTTRLVLSRPLEMRLRNPMERTLDRLRDLRKPKDKVIEQPSVRMRLRPNILDRGRRATIRRANRLVANTENTGLISVGDRGKLTVDLPYNHPICVKRRERKEIMFAKKKAGRGAGRQRKPKMPELTVRCK